MSDKSRSTKPSSKMPKSEDDEITLPSAMLKDMSIAPQSSKVSSSCAPAKEQNKKAKSTFAPIPEDDVLEEEYDDFEELTTPKSNYPELISPSKQAQSRVPSSSIYYDAKSTLTEKSNSVMPSAMFKDESKAPKAKSVMPSVFFKDESKASKAKSMMPSAFFKDESKATKAKSVMPSAFFKDESKATKAKSVMPSAFFKDESMAPKAKSVMPSSRFKDESYIPKSFIVTKEDKIMSTRQTEFASLAPKEQKKQDEWAQKKIKEMKSCPEQYDWVRKDEHGFSGYICAEGRHGMSDILIAEGDGGIIILKEKGDLASSKGLAGPWYPHPTIKNCYISVIRHEPLEGVKWYEQPAFLGSSHQSQRAKWEYYNENLDEAIKDNYKWPEKEPPKEWADEKNVPKTNEEREAKNAAKK
ncbi:hypothetical protein BKA64DRAFT_647446 [Cadophora sp. MPI-SDFR-AT-0126]|nr:hypothetical protein BKA64DRAFT_647446 [Leotiomycetes sp. MPI-SDFR-AT-0126]